MKSTMFERIIITVRVSDEMFSNWQKCQIQKNDQFHSKSTNIEPSEFYFVKHI